MDVIAVVGRKGGSGKTTTCINLAGVMAERGKTVSWSTSTLRGASAVAWEEHLAKPN